VKTIFKLPRISLFVLIAALLAVLFAGFLAPYDFAYQNRRLPFAPPTRIHFLDTNHRFHIRPFVYRWQASDSGTYTEDQRIAYPVHFLVPAIGPQFSARQIYTSRLFGADNPAQILLIGSDGYGRDQFSRFLYGGQISLFAGILATAISMSLGMLGGCLAGFYGSWLDELIMRTAEVFLTLPWLYLLFAVRAFLPLEMAPGQIFILLLTVIGVIGWASPARVIRGVVLSAKERNYVLAAKGFGASDFYLLRRHILPQVLSVALTQSVTLMPRYILAEVVLSFFGLGVSEPVPSWGNMLAALRQYQVLESYWWMFLPALLLFVIFLGYYDLCS
jgi:peptide/nickel transport system permease protein